MNRISSITFLAAMAASGLAAAAPAYTTPVGYVTHTIAGAVGSSPSETLVGVTLVSANTYVGVSTNNPSSTNTITVSGSLPSGINSGYYVEITSGASEGWWSTVTSVSGSTITIADNFPSGLAVGASFAVRAHQTIKGYFGLNTPGLATGSDLDAADEVQILNPATQTVYSYFFATQADGGPVGGGWFNGAGITSDNEIIEPGSSVLIKRKKPNNLTFTSSGVVKVTKTQIDIYKGTNWIAPMRAGNVTLGASNLDTGVIATGLQRGTDLSVDELQVINLNQSVDGYFAADPVQAPGYSGFYNGAGASFNSLVLDASVGYRIIRKNNSPAIITIPAQTVGQ